MLQGFFSVLTRTGQPLGEFCREAVLDGFDRRLAWASPLKDVYLFERQDDEDLEMAIELLTAG
jgi:hypothetical protein